MSESTPNESSFINRYHSQMAVKALFIVLCGAALVLVIGLLSVSMYDGISLTDTYRIIWDHINGVTYSRTEDSLKWWADRYIWNIIIPRILAGVAAGASLAIAGALMQSLMTNPLADPYSTGISSGACFGAVSAIVTGATMNMVIGQYGTVGGAFIGALIPSMIIIVLANRIRMTPATLILIGTAISYFFNSMVTYLMISTDADTLQSAYLWQIGSLDSMSWSGVWIMIAVAAIGSVITLSLYKKLNIMSLGDRAAHSLGLNVQGFRTVCLIVMSVMTAGVIAFTGIIGFVGLVAPHMVRIIVGSDNRFVLPASMLFGALLLIVADYLAQAYAGGIAVGVVMSAIGSPIFLMLIIWQKKGKGAIY